jgi:TolA-binding protein
MRSPTMKHRMGLSAIVAVLISLAVATAYSQSQTQSGSRMRSRSEWQQSQANPSLGGQPDFGQRMMERHALQMQEMQQEIEEMQRQAEASRNLAIQQSLRASDEQWCRIKPKLDRIEKLKAEAEVSAGPNSAGGNGNFQGQGFMFGGGSTGGGSGMAFGSGTGGMGSPGNSWSNSWTTGPKNPMEMTPGESLCQELNHMLLGESVPAAEIAVKVAALRQLRAQARQDLVQARQELRGMIHPNQEPALVVMGYLD